MIGGEPGTIAAEEVRTRQDIVIACCRLLYSRLLAGRVVDKDRTTVQRELSDRVREGLWPSYETDSASSAKVPRVGRERERN